MSTRTSSEVELALLDEPDPLAALEGDALAALIAAERKGRELQQRVWQATVAQTTAQLEPQ
jgi:hypothetical protein